MLHKYGHSRVLHWETVGWLLNIQTVQYFEAAVVVKADNSILNRNQTSINQLWKSFCTWTFFQVLCTSLIQQVCMCIEYTYILLDCPTKNWQRHRANPDWNLFQRNATSAWNVWSYCKEIKECIQLPLWGIMIMMQTISIVAISFGDDFKKSQELK